MKCTEVVMKWSIISIATDTHEHNLDQLSSKAMYNVKGMHVDRGTGMAARRL
jgi:hypothetical protein